VDSIGEGSMPTREVKKKLKPVPHKDFYCLGSKRKPCIICGKNTEKTIINKCNRVKYLELTDVSTLDWDAIYRYLDVLNKRLTIEVEGGKRLTAYNVYHGRCSTPSWDLVSGNRSEKVLWEGEDFSNVIPYSLYDYSTKAKFRRLKDKKRAIISYFEKRNQTLYETHTRLDSYDTDNACCSNKCLNMWLLRMGHA